MIPKVPSEENNVTHRLEDMSLTGILSTKTFSGKYFTLVNILAVQVREPVYQYEWGAYKPNVKALVQVADRHNNAYGVKVWVDYDLIHEVA